MAVKTPEVLLLDAGNTVVFLDHVALSEAASRAGLSVSAEALSRAEPSAKRAYEALMQRGVAHEDGWMLHARVIFETAGLSEADAAEAARVARRAHDAFNLWRRVPDGLLGALERLARAGVRCGIVSNAEGTLMALLDRLDLSRHFEVVVDSGLEGVSKPDPEIFRRALTRMGARAEATLYAGDIPRVDVEGARSAGIDAVLIDPFDHYADYTEAPRFPSVAALVDAMGL
jgi:putative hydrolase of the HAD superfamily